MRPMSTRSTCIPAIDSWSRRIPVHSRTPRRLRSGSPIGQERCGRGSDNFRRRSARLARSVTLRSTGSETAGRRDEKGEGAGRKRPGRAVNGEFERTAGAGWRNWAWKRELISLQRSRSVIRAGIAPSSLEKTRGCRAPRGSRRRSEIAMFGKGFRRSFPHPGTEAEDPRAPKSEKRINENLPRRRMHRRPRLRLRARFGKCARVQVCSGHGMPG